MINKRTMINNWFKKHTYVTRDSDNVGNNEYRCPHCNQLDFMVFAIVVVTPWWESR